MLATTIQMTIFPDVCAFEHYQYAIEQNKDYEKYYLVYEKNEIIGITGFYSNEPIEETNSIWLGWYGILEIYRQKGYGKQILLDTMEMTKSLLPKYPIYYFRLYTSELDDAIAQPLYQKIMDIKEYYYHPEDSNENGNLVIYTKSFGKEPIEKWNNRFLNYYAILATQESGKKEFLRIQKELAN